MALAYKLLADGNGIQVDDEGRPLVIDDEDDNKEFGLDAIHLYSKIPALQAEAKTYREEKQAVTDKFKAFGDTPAEEILAKLESFGDMNPKDAKEALTAVSNFDKLDQEKNIEIERLKAGVAEAYKTKMHDIDIAHGKKVAALEGAVSNKDSSIRRLLIKGAFDSSTFIRDQTTLPPEIAYNQFGKHFEIEEDGDKLVVVARNYTGDRIMSIAKPGDYAPPEEAIELLINQYSQRDSIMRTSGGGSGAAGNVSTNASKRAKLEALKGLNPVARLNALRR